MQNDSLETLLSRHFGSTAPVPPNLEERLCTSIRQEAAELRSEQLIATFLGQKRVSRRKAVKWVALGTAGASLLSLGLGSLQALEATLVGRDTTQPKYT